MDLINQNGIEFKEKVKKKNLTDLINPLKFYKKKIDKIVNVK